MVGRILIDTNILLDYLLEREPFFEDAKKVDLKPELSYKNAKNNRTYI